MGLREVAVSRSLDNITILILGLKGLKRTIKKLNQGVSLQQLRQQHHNEQRNVANTYDQDFFEVEVNETDLFSQNINETDSAGNVIDDEIFEIGSKPQAQQSPRSNQQPHGHEQPTHKV